MDEGLLVRAQKTREGVRVKIAREQTRLEEEHAGDPNGGRAAEPRQNQFGDERLDQEQQARAGQDGGSEKKLLQARPAGQEKRIQELKNSECGKKEDTSSSVVYGA